MDAGNHVVVKEIGEGKFVVCGAVRLGVSGAILFRTVGCEGPREFLRFEVDGKELALMRTDIDAIAGERG